MKSWKLRTIPDKNELKALSKYSDLLKHFLYFRGVKTEHEADVFLNPDYERDMHDPEKLSDMESACERIEKAIYNREKIAIYADYDADGIPGSVVLHDFFHKINFENFIVYIPHRYKEGYGLNKEAIKKIKNENVSLIITVDCGITNIEEAVFAKTLGIDLIITDHHLPGEVTPPAYAVINPNQKHDKYENNNLCGGGVAFKLVQALIKRNNITKSIPRGWEKWLLDVAGISTISDMVPLVGENRAIAHFGLNVLRQSKRPGLKKLFYNKKIIQTNLTEEDVGFVIAPHINAASRMGSPYDGFFLLSTRDHKEANEKVMHLSKKNEERKLIVESIIKEIEEILSKNKLKEIVSIGNPNWNSGLLGLVANRVSEKYNRPVCLWGSVENGVIRGSCRSDGSINIVELMNNISGVFIDSGGHEYSGGFSVTQENVDLLEDEFARAYKKSFLSEEQKKEEEILIDMKLPKELICWDTYNELSKMAPFGIGNKKPTFLIENIKIKTYKLFGRNKDHLKVIFDLGNKKEIEGVSFFIKNDNLLSIKEGGYADAVVCLEKDTFLKRIPKLRLRIVSFLNN